MHRQRRVICWLTFAIALFASQVAWALPPVATNDSYSTSVNTTLTMAAPGVLANDVEPDGQSLTAVRVSNPSHGTLTLNANGSFTYRPATNYSGSDAFTYKAYDGGNYSGVATVTITVTPAITIVTPPANATACPGGTATFTIVANGTALKYQWRFGATALPGATNSTLMLDNVNAASAGTYSVVVSGQAGASKTNSATLTVDAAVNVTPLTNLTRFVGSIAIFSTTPSGAGPFTYVWKKDDSVISGQTSSKLTLADVQVSDSATYSVVISGACGSVTNSATLTVATCFPSVDVMLVIDRSGSMTGKPYTDARAACTNFVRNLQFGPTNDMAGIVIYNTNSALRQTLTNNAAVLEEAVNLFPAATNGTRITYGLTNAQAELFSVRHRSNALPVMVLFSDGLPNSGDSPSNVLYHAQLAKNAGTRVFTVGLGAVDLSLMSAAASSTNDFFYTTDSSQLGALFDAISTIICRPPTNIFGPSDVTVCAGASVSLDVMASGCAAFTFQWRKDGVTLAGQTNNSISFNNVVATDAGVYSVVVSSVCRTVTNNATLTVNSPAIIVTPPEDRIGFIGSNTLFSVNATGTGLSYEWRFNGSLVGTNSTLAVNNPGTNHAGTYCVRVASSVCGGAVTNCATLTIQNRAPLAGSDSYSTPEDTVLTIGAPGVLANDSDMDNDPLTSVLASNPAHGTLTLNANGSFTYQPALNYNGPDSFTYRASDGDLTSAVTTVNITVTPRNDPPVANNDAYTMTADTTLTISAPGVLANDTDVENPDPSGLTALLASNPAHGTLTLNAAGSFIYQPNANYSGSDSFTYRASDGSATSGTATVTITINPVTIVIVTPPTNRTNCPGDIATFRVTATGTALSYQWLFGANVLNGQTNSTLTLPNVAATNGGTYCAIVNGAAGGPVTNCAVLVVNENVIVVTPPSSRTNCPNTTALFSVNATGTALRYQWYFGAAALSGQTNATLALSNVTEVSAGVYTIMVSGACGVSVAMSATLTLNENVTVVNPPVSQTSFVGSNIVFSVGATGTGLSYRWFFNGQVIGTNSTLTINNLTTNQAGSYCVMVSGVCGIPMTTCRTLTIQNRPPTARDDNYATPEDTALTIAAPGVLANDSDIDGDLFTAVLVSNPTHGTLNLSTNGAFVYTPSLNYTGLDTFTYRTSDSRLTSGAATVTITITPVNDVPVAVNDDFYTTAEDTTLTIPAPGILANDIDVDGNPLRAVLVSNVSHGTLNLSTNGAFVYTPSLNYTGLDTFTYRATDGLLTSGVATVTITITPVNDAPVAVNDDSYTTVEDTTLTIAAPGVLTNDIDVDGNPLSTLLVTSVSHGTLNLSANGAFVYTPSLNYTGVDTFTYRATDGSLTSGVATVTITITPVNDAPVAVNDDFYTTVEDTTLTIAAPGILANDIDVDGNPLKAVLVSSVSHGALNLSTNGAFVYTPSLNYTGVDTFTYRATDGSLTSDVASVTITITPVNDAPVAANDDFYTTPEDTTLTIAAAGILANDIDVDDDPLKAVLVSNVSHGTLNLSTNGAFVYTPSLNYTGVDTFTYRATDGSLTSGVATVTIKITPVNDAPVAVNDDFFTTPEDTTLTIVAPGILANDTDADGNPLSALLVSTVSHGTLNFSTNGAFVYTPSLNYTGVDTFTYRATDGILISGVATVTITITPVNDAPVAANDDFYTTIEDTTLTIAAPGVLANDSDVDGDALKAVLVSNVSHGTLNLATNGAFVYTPSLNYTGVDTFTYRATDGALSSSVATVTITITPVNDAPVAVNDDFYTTPEDTTLTIIAPGILANDIDVDGNPLSAILVSSVSHGTLNLNANGAFVYTPSLNYTGLDTFTYRATDGSLTSGVATVTIKMTPVNDPPATGVAGDNYSILEDRTLTVATPGILANDSDADGDTLRAILINGPSHGTLALDANGSFTYVPSANYFGPDSFTYAANDGQTNSLPAVVSITVIPVNDVPGLTGSGDQKLNENAPAQSVPNWATSISAGPANESDQTLTFDVSNDNHSLFSAQPAIAPNGTLTYTPAANVFGVATVRVTLRDNGGTANGGVDISSEVVFRIVVNSPPTVSIVSPTDGSALLYPANFSIIASANDPDGTVTNVQFLVNDTVFTNVMQAPFYFVMSNVAPGSYQFRAIAMDNCGLGATSGVVSIEVITNAVVATGPIVLNRQSGLFEQFVTVSNRTTETWPNGVRLWVYNVDLPNFVWNPTGTNNDAPYLDNLLSVPPGGEVMFLVVYYIPNPRSVPVPTLVSVPLPFEQPMEVPQIVRIKPAGEAMFDMHFTSQSSRFYFIQHTEDFVHWTTGSEPLRGNGAIVTCQQPNTGGKCFYRVLMAP